MRSSGWMKIGTEVLMSEIVAIIITGTHDDVERPYRRLETLLYRLIGAISHQHELYHYIISGFSYYRSLE